MPIIIILLFSSVVFGATKHPDATFKILDKPFNLERNLKSKVVGLGVHSKVLDLSSEKTMDMQNKKITAGYKLLKDEWMTEFKTKFSKEEIAYMETLFAHPLLMRFIQFQNNFLASEAKNSVVIEELKKNPVPSVPVKK
jgi:hypothetical protein